MPAPSPPQDQIRQTLTADLQSRYYRTSVATRYCPSAMFVNLLSLLARFRDRYTPHVLIIVFSSLKQLFLDNQPPNAGPNGTFDGCPLYGIELSGGRYLANLGMWRSGMHEGGL